MTIGELVIVVGIGSVIMTGLLLIYLQLRMFKEHHQEMYRRKGEEDGEVVDEQRKSDD